MTVRFTLPLWFYTVSLPFAILNPVIQLLLLIWVIPATLIALFMHSLRKCCSQFPEPPDVALDKSFWRALGVFIRLKIFPRIRQERVLTSVRPFWTKTVHFDLRPWILTSDRTLLPKTAHFTDYRIETLQGQQILSAIRTRTKQRIHFKGTKTRTYDDFGSEISFSQSKNEHDLRKFSKISRHGCPDRGPWWSDRWSGFFFGPVRGPNNSVPSGQPCFKECSRPVPHVVQINTKQWRSKWLYQS